MRRRRNFEPDPNAKTLTSAEMAENLIDRMLDADRREFLLRMCGGDVIEYFSIDVAEIARERASS